MKMSFQANEEEGPDYFESESAAVEKFNSSTGGNKGLIEEQEEEIQKYPKILYKLHVVEESLNKLELPKKIDDLTKRFGSDNSLDSAGDDNLSTTSTLRYCPEEETVGRPITRENLQSIVQQLRDVYSEVLEKVGESPREKAAEAPVECEKAENVDREEESKKISMLEEKVTIPIGVLNLIG